MNQEGQIGALFFGCCLWRLIPLLACGIFLSACSGLLDNTLGLVMGRGGPPPTQAPPQPLPNVKQIIANNIKTLFDPSSKPKT